MTSMNTMKTVLEEYSRTKLKNNYNLQSFIKIVENWERIVGPTVYKICIPNFYYNHVVNITVLDSIWANELIMKQVTIIKNIKNITGLEVVSIRTKIGEIERPERIVVNKSKESEHKVISEENKKWIFNTMTDANIENEEVKNMFETALREICLE